ncbi:MAG: NAD(P)/FAD-dependent oxidoreductase [Paludibacteraceae bacterium]|jgi:all-trans-retinol 13,14-reductase|nr:NAD(P)/FAD-dependent oxidoreductase [Paludibacteraceae bacterium]
MKKYDVIIIGGGLGGLVSGAILSKEGFNVCVLEQHSVAGGCLQSFKRNGRILDTGMHYVGSLSEGQIVHQYFKYLGVIDSLYLQKLDESGFDYFHFSDGTSFCHAMGYDNFTETLSKQFPNEKEGIQTISKTIKQVGELICPKILKKGKISNRGIEYMSVSAYNEIKKHIRDEKLRNVFAGNTCLYAGNKITTSLYEYGMITHSNIEGAYAFKDGSQQLADRLVDRIKSNGGEVILKAKVSKIHLNSDKVEYLLLDSGERFCAKWIISSLHPSVTFSLLENNSIYKKAFFTRMNSLPNTYGFFTTYLLTKPNTLKYINQNHYLFNNSDVWDIKGDYKGYNIPSTLLCMQPNSGSEYTKVVTLLTPMLYSACEQWHNTSIGNRGEDYLEFKENFSEAVVDFVCQFYPNLRNCIYKKYTASPLTYRDYTSTPSGCAYGIIKDCRNPLVTLMLAKTKISNLLITGQSLNIHGCLGTTISSAVTCSEILGMEYLSKKIGNA